MYVRTRVRYIGLLIIDIFSHFVDRLVNFDMEDTKMNRAVIRTLVQAGGGGDRVLSLTRGGESSAAKNNTSYSTVDRCIGRAFANLKN